MKNKGNTNFVRVKKDRNYSVIYNEVLQRADISWQAKGIFAFLMTLPDDWEIRKTSLHNFASNGKYSTRKILTELEDIGYVTKKAVRKENGQFSGWNYIIRERLTDGNLTDCTKSPHRLIGQRILSTKNKQNTNNTIYTPTKIVGGETDKKDFNFSEQIKEKSLNKNQIISLFLEDVETIDEISQLYANGMKSKQDLINTRDLFLEIIEQGSDIEINFTNFNRINKYNRFLGADETLSLSLEVGFIEEAEKMVNKLR